MGGAFRPRGRTILPLLLSLFCAGCSRPSEPRGGDTAGQADQHPVPFRAGDDRVAADPGLVTTGAADDGTGSEAGVPFHDSRNLPAGTLLTVRLENSISPDTPGASRTFVALVDEPIVIEGTTVVPRGASVAGRVESAWSSTIGRNRGYVRLTLDVVDISGRELPIRTSSLFARGKAEESQDRKALDAVSVEQGRRLTFRLTEPISVLTHASAPRR
jgi:hypothetical protein